MLLLAYGRVKGVSGADGSVLVSGASWDMGS